MTNEKAIMCLEDMKIKVPIPKAAKQARENNEALDVAIKALAESEHGTNLAEVGTNCSEFPNNSDAISRQAAIEALENDKAALDKIIKGMSAMDVRLDAYVSQRNQVVYDIDAIEQLPPIQPEPQEIGYDDCANALLKMWMDNVLTDGDYYRIADKLNKKWGKIELPEPYTEPYKGVTE